MVMSVMIFVCPVLFGAYNAYNVLAAVSMATRIQIHPGIIPTSIAKHFLVCLEGYKEHALPNVRVVLLIMRIIQNLLKAVLSTLRALTEQFDCGFWCGGGRDKIKTTHDG